MAIDLEGQIDVSLVGRIDSVKEGLRTRFRPCPMPDRASHSTCSGAKRVSFRTAKGLCGKPKKARCDDGRSNGVKASQGEVQAACERRAAKRELPGRDK